MAVLKRIITFQRNNNYALPGVWGETRYKSFRMELYWPEMYDHGSFW
jgi:hypothetical protein